MLQARESSVHNIVKEAHGKLIEISKSKKQYQGLLADLTVQVHKTLAMLIGPQSCLQPLGLTPGVEAHQKVAVPPLRHGVHADPGQATKLFFLEILLCVRK